MARKKVLNKTQKLVIDQTDQYAKENGFEPAIAFQRYTTDLFLRSYQPSPEDLEDGDTDGWLDGGIDGFYLFVDGNYVAVLDDVDVSSIRDNPDIELYLIQNKSTPHFEEVPLIKLCDTAKRILDEDDGMGGLNDRVRQKRDMFHEVWNVLGRKIPSVTVHLVYVANAPAANGYPSVLRVAERLVKECRDRYGKSVCVKTRLVDSDNIYDLAKKTISYTKELPYLEKIETESAYVITTTLEWYFDFITDESGSDEDGVGSRKIADYLFDSNVRHFQRDVAVNKEIVKTLQNESSCDFWWLNNGITIICSELHSTSKRFTLKDIQIVNGLQTSYCIYGARLDGTAKIDYKTQRLLVKVIETQDTNIRDKVIKATNSQTSMQAWSLRATDKIQRQIEDYFLLRGLYYDRRKGYHKNMKRKLSDIVSITYVGQCVIAMGLSKPDEARARPMTFLKKDNNYDLVFNDNVDLNLFLQATLLQRRIDQAIRSSDVSRRHFGNIRFHVSTYVCTLLMKERIHSLTDLERIVDKMPSVSDQLISHAIDQTRNILLKVVDDESNASLDKVAKSPTFSSNIIDAALLDRFVD